MFAAHGVDLSSSQLEEARKIKATILDNNAFQGAAQVANFEGEYVHTVKTFDEAYDLLYRFAKDPKDPNELRVIHFAGHGDKTLLFEGMTSSPDVGVLADAITRCRPDAAIFNACCTGALAKQTDELCPEGGLLGKPLIIYWDSQAENEPCVMLAKWFYKCLLDQLHPLAPAVAPSTVSATLLATVYRESIKPLKGPGLIDREYDGHGVCNKLRCNMVPAV